MAELTPDNRIALQRADALKLANQTRMVHANVRREIRSLSTVDGCHWVARLLEAHDARVQRMTIGSLLNSIWKIGRVKTSDLIRAVGIQTQDRRVDDLTERQFEELAWHLRTWDLWPASRRNGSRKR